MDRRDFMKLAGAAGALLAARPLALLAAQRNQQPAVLSGEQWRTVDAICERILPGDDGPGATAANCVNFIDKLLANEEARLLPLYRDGLAALARSSQGRWQKDFVDLNVPQQIELLELLEDGELEPWPGDGVDQQQLFGTLRVHTLFGFLAAPKYGGNQNMVGWQVIGFPDHVHERGGLSDEQVSGVKPIPMDWHGHGRK